MLKRPSLSLFFCTLLLLTTVSVQAKEDVPIIPKLEGQHFSAVRSYFDCLNADFNLLNWNDTISCSDAYIELKKVDSSEFRGTILKQIPAAGSPLGESAELYLRVSNGLIPPNLVHLPLSEAQSILTTLGIPFLHSQTTIHLGVATGFVAHQIPAPFTRLDASRQVVFLDVSSSPGVKVPNLRGMSHNKLQETLHPLGLTFIADEPLPDTIFESICKPSFHYSYDKVTSTQPASGAYVHPNTKFIVTFSIRQYTQDGEPCYNGVPL